MSSFSSCFCILVSFPQMLSGPLFSIHIYDIGTKMNHKLCLQRLLDRWISFCVHGRDPQEWGSTGLFSKTLFLWRKKKNQIFCLGVYICWWYSWSQSESESWGKWVTLFSILFSLWEFFPDFSTWYPQVLSYFSVISLENKPPVSWLGFWFHGDGWEAWGSNWFWDTLLIHPLTFSPVLIPDFCTTWNLYFLGFSKFYILSILFPQRY